MKYKIIISPSAKSDIREIRKYIKIVLQNPTAAKRRISLLQSKINELRNNPQLYPLLLDDLLALKGFRSVAAKNHIIFYVINEKNSSVYVVRVMYYRRDWANILKDDINNLLNDINEL